MTVIPPPPPDETVVGPSSRTKSLAAVIEAPPDATIASVPPTPVLTFVATGVFAVAVAVAPLPPITEALVESAVAR